MEQGNLYTGGPAFFSLSLCYRRALSVPKVPAHVQ